jgi:hypothetical protein
MPASGFKPVVVSGTQTAQYATGFAVDGNSQTLLYADDISPANGGKASAELLGVFVRYTASSGVGTRALVLELLDPNDSDAVIMRIPASVGITASQIKGILFAQGIHAPVSAIIDGATSETANLEQLPTGIRLSGSVKLRVRDAKNVTSGDTMTISLLFKD